MWCFYSEGGRPEVLWKSIWGEWRLRKFSLKTIRRDSEDVVKFWLTSSKMRLLLFCVFLSCVPFCSSADRNDRPIIGKCINTLLTANFVTILRLKPAANRPQLASKTFGKLTQWRVMLLTSHSWRHFKPTWFVLLNRCSGSRYSFTQTQSVILHRCLLCQVPGVSRSESCTCHVSYHLLTHFITVTYIYCFMFIHRCVSPGTFNITFFFF